MQIKLAPSMMCSNYANLLEDVRLVDEAKIDYLHCDIMDGHYVPNLIVGPDYIKTLRRISKSKIDLHLMVEKPELFVDMFDMQPGERISFHYETTYHPHRLVTQLKKMGLETGIALAPSVPLGMLEDLLPELDFVQIMAVNPGFAGQPLIGSAKDKIKRLREMLKGKDVDIVVDGCVDYENISEFIDAGANVFILGVYSCFDKKLGIADALKKIKDVVHKS